jgi:hypothetical protein
MAALIGDRLMPLLPSQWPEWSDNVFMGGLAIIAAVSTIINERIGYSSKAF